MNKDRTSGSWLIGSNSGLRAVGVERHERVVAARVGLSCGVADVVKSVGS